MATVPLSCIANLLLVSVREHATAECGRVQRQSKARLSAKEVGSASVLRGITRVDGHFPQSQSGSSGAGEGAGAALLAQRSAGVHTYELRDTQASSTAMGTGPLPLPVPLLFCGVVGPVSVSTLAGKLRSVNTRSHTMMTTKQLHPLFVGEVSGVDLRGAIDVATLDAIVHASDR